MVLASIMAINIGQSASDKDDIVLYNRRGDASDRGGGLSVKVETLNQAVFIPSVKYVILTNGLYILRRAKVVNPDY